MRPFYILGAIAFCILNAVVCRAQAEPAPALHEPQAASSDANTNSEFARAMMESMAKMDRDMMAAPMTDNPDHAFAVMMIPHHQGAIDMARIQLLYGKDPQMRRLAQEIITDQQLEIELMLRWLKQRELASTVENQTPAPDTKKKNQK